MSSPSHDCRVANAADAYLAAHEALVEAGVRPDRPEAAKRLADTWLNLTRAVRERRKIK
jgi:hypothetical protein